MVPTGNVYHIVPQSRIHFEGPPGEKLFCEGFLVLFSNAKPSTQYPWVGKHSEPATGLIDPDGHSLFWLFPFSR